MKLRLGLSPCPNDTFIFHALLHGLVDTGDVAFEPVMEDVEALNERMLRAELPVTKASFAAYAAAREHYAVLRTGGALGRANGPLVVSRRPMTPADLAGKRVIVPGALTTAALLLRTFHPEVAETSSDRYDRVVAALERGEADAAVIIHELRFTYREQGLHAVEDLGQRFEDATGMPVPLGGIFVRRDVERHVALDVERWVGESLALARENPSACVDYVRDHAQEIAAEVTAAHIDLYVNEFSAGYGAEGERAIGRLLERAVDAGTAQPSELPVFL